MDFPTSPTPAGNRPPGQTGKMARPLNPDLPAWEKQERETAEGYAHFLAYRDSEKRKVSEHGPNAKFLSATWSWPYRALEWDRYLARLDVEDMIRYRVGMNERHRGVARLAQARAVAWLTDMNERDVKRLKAAEVIRMMEIGVRIEREAAGGTLPDGVPDTPEGLQPSMTGRTLGEVLGLTDVEEEMEVARELAALLDAAQEQE